MDLAVMTIMGPPLLNMHLKTGPALSCLQNNLLEMLLTQQPTPVDLLKSHLDYDDLTLNMLQAQLSERRSNHAVWQEDCSQGRNKRYPMG